MDSSETNANRKFTIVSSAMAEQPLLDFDDSSTNPQNPDGTFPWSSGLFDCCADVKNCCTTMWCPCITFGQISEVMNEGTTCVSQGAIYALVMCLPGLNCCFSSGNRMCMREQFSLKDISCGEAPCSDFWVHCFCEQCALCQEYRELKSQGYDMNIGWRKNVAREIRAIVVEKAPPLQFFEIT